MAEIIAGINLTLALGITMNKIVNVSQVIKNGANLNRKLIMGLKNSRIGALDIKSTSSVFMNIVMLLERIIKTGAIIIIVR